nr:rhomboid family protein [Arabidopsis thaliana]
MKPPIFAKLSMKGRKPIRKFTVKIVNIIAKAEILLLYRFQFFASAESMAPINPKKAAPEEIDGMFRTNNTANRLPIMPERKYMTAILNGPNCCSMYIPTKIKLPRFMNR